VNAEDRRRIREFGDETLQGERRAAEEPTEMNER